MKIEDLKNKRVTVMGLGLHGGGVGTINFLYRSGARITVTDIRPKEELMSSIEKLRDFKNVQYVFGQHRSEDFTKADLVVKNPGIPWDNKHIRLALEKNVPVEIDSSLFFKLCHKPIIGVTGTKGKTTTSSLIYEILKTAGKNPVKVGVGQISVLDKLLDLKKNSVIVFELSSWRLSALGRYGLSPRVAVFTNLYPDHLNYYKNMETYLRDKKNIFRNQKSEDVCVINWDIEELRNLEGEIRSDLVKFSGGKIEQGKSVFVEGDSIFLNDGIDKKKVLEISSLKLRGKHNLSNIMASIGATYFFGVALKDIVKAIGEFSGIAHRLEFVKKIDGVNYYNDTAATTPESAISGIRSFQEPIILIAGGADKNLDLSALASVILEKTKDAVLLKGKATDKILEKIKKMDPDRNFSVATSMEEAVELAKKKAQEGDVVLLSPGAASFGLFQNEFDRGDKFKEAVSHLK